jgi:hypothetical protein
MRTAIFFWAVALLFVGCSKDDDQVPTYPEGISVVSPEDGDTIMVPVEELRYMGPWWARHDMTAHLIANIPGGPVALSRYYAFEYPVEHWCHDPTPSFYPQSADFRAPYVCAGDRFSTTTQFTFYFRVIAGDSSVWFSRYIHIVALADTTHNPEEDITILSPANGDTVHVPVDGWPYHWPPRIRNDMMAHIVANIPGGPALTMRGCAYYSWDWYGAPLEWFEYHPQSADFRVPYLRVEEEFGLNEHPGDCDTTEFMFCYRITAGDGSEWFSPTVYIVALADTTH